MSAVAVERRLLDDDDVRHDAIVLAAMRSHRSPISRRRICRATGLRDEQVLAALTRLQGPHVQPDDDGWWLTSRRDRRCAEIAGGRYGSWDAHGALRQKIIGILEVCPASERALARRLDVDRDVIAPIMGSLLQSRMVELAVDHRYRLI